jgi:thiol-disulfide isomerase/thioredoxin
MKFSHLMVLCFILFSISATGTTQAVSSRCGSTTTQVARKSSGSHLRGVSVGKRFPALQFKDLDGNVVSLGKLKGKVILIDFWATWCPPCVKETPNLLSIYEEFNDEGFEIIGISLDRSRQKLMDYVSKKKIAWPNYFDGKGWDNKIASTLGIQSIPLTLLLDRQGVVSKIGLRGEHIREAVEEAIQIEQPPASVPEVK